jgi:hypothetical protein
MTAANTFDAKCYDLASHFLFDHPTANTEAARVTLATIIQETIETEITIMLAGGVTVGRNAADNRS